VDAAKSIDGASAAEDARDSAAWKAGLVAEQLDDHDLPHVVELAMSLADAEFAAIHWFNAMPGCVATRTDYRFQPPTPALLEQLSAVVLSRDDDRAFTSGDLVKDVVVTDSELLGSASDSIRFFAAIALRDESGAPLGTLSVGSSRAVSEQEAEVRARELPALAHVAMSLVEGREEWPEPGAAATGVAGLPQRRLVRPRRPIDYIIDNRAVTTLFQPIVHLESGAVVAFEALSRGPEGTDLESPIAMLDAARDVGRLDELDWLCRVHAMRDAAAARLPPSVSWFINVEPAGIRSECPDHLRGVLDRAKTQLRVILEVPEREIHVHVADLIRATDEARRDTWGVALDDVGADEGSLALLPIFQPDVVKLDMALMDGIPSGASVEVVGAVHAYAERTGAVILAEGIETDEHKQLAIALGATYGQGHLYGYPGSLPEELAVPKHPVPLRQRPQPLTEASPFDVAASHVSPKRSQAEHLMPFLTHMLEHCGRATEAAVLLAIFANEDHYRARADAYEQLAKGNAFTVCLVPGTDIHRDEPRFHVAAPPANGPLTSEWGVIVLAPHFAAALLLRTVTGPTEEPNQIDYIFSHERPLVLAAARSFIHHMNNERIQHAIQAEAEAEKAAKTETAQTETPVTVPQPTSAIKRLMRK